MSEPTDIVLRFAYPPPPSTDIRTFRVYQVIAGSESETSGELELYKFLHPATGHGPGITTYHRKNMITLLFDTAGQIEWTSNTSATAYIGADEVSVKDLRRVKYASSQSRRFKVSGAEYKWKMSENGVDMFCIDSKEKHIATWTQETQLLKVAPRAGTMLDRLVVTCFLNTWFKQLGKW
ncbi:hypothetical protein BJ138DRAFT_1167630 [Hygrophoropsis aurantiaca]|uniref:Uncharacterized protein n=1 Tax=Hygrophoropsis aurantiaca TaxID=72124 RepID=A0ACB7ZTW7_9AGAM|nr:hypothetical protein BJ138DRAFT_1167630 [Hygrophoropsis aurantiaca]